MLVLCGWGQAWLTWKTSAWTKAIQIKSIFGLLRFAVPLYLASLGIGTGDFIVVCQSFIWGIPGDFSAGLDICPQTKNSQKTARTSAALWSLVFGNQPQAVWMVIAASGQNRRPEKNPCPFIDREVRLIETIGFN
jgi:hypothetical protein